MKTSIFTTLAALLTLPSFAATTATLPPAPPPLSAGPGVIAPVLPTAQIFADLAERAMPSVVNISTTSLAQGRDWSDMPGFPFMLPPPSRKNGKPSFPRRGGVPRSSALGTGFVIDADKKIVITNNHVVADA